MQTPQQLNDEFGIPGVLRFDEPFPGMPRGLVSSPACTAEFYLHGAHLTAWQPAGQESGLFLAARSAFAPGKAIRGGIPVIFPWFGAPKDSPIPAPPGAPSHGFARTGSWTLRLAALAGDELHLSLTLDPSEAQDAAGFGGSQLACEMRLGHALEISLIVGNTGNAPLEFEEALHTYLTVGDVRQIAVEGLRDTEFLDKTEGFARKRQDDPTLRFTAEVDRPYLNTEATVTVIDPVLKRRLVVGKSGSRTTVTWNPGPVVAGKLEDLGADAFPHFVCIETANAVENRITLAPGEAHTMRTTITVEPLAG